jgi:hypothetical protein
MRTNFRNLCQAETKPVMILRMGPFLSTIIFNSGAVFKPLLLFKGYGNGKCHKPLYPTQKTYDIDNIMQQVVRLSDLVVAVF